MKKKIFIASLIVLAAIGLTSGATLSYFTDTKSVENNFTIGMVKVGLYESTLNRTSETTDADIIADAANFDNYLSGLVLQPGMQIQKRAYLKNEGNVPIYVRLRYLIPNHIWLYDKILSYSANSAATRSGEWEANKLMADAYINNSENTRIRYTQYEFRRVQPLQPGEMTTLSPIDMFTIPSNVTSEQIETAIANHYITEDGEFSVFYFADAIQSDGFSDVDAAFADMAPTYN